MSSHRLRPTPRLLAVIGVAVSLLPVGCSGDDDAASETSTTTSPTSTTAATTTTVAVDQTAPAGANGIKVADDGSLWIASLASDVILNVDATTGQILRRVEVPAKSGPDDLVLDDDGALFWTGYVSGAIGEVAPDSSGTTVIANIGVGANPIALRGDGKLIAGLAGAATGLFVIDPVGDPTPQPLADPGNFNSFDITADGQLFAPSLDTRSVIELDPDTGEVVRTVAPVNGTPIAARWHDGDVYVLVLADAAHVYRVDPSAGTVELFGSTGLALADNLAVGDDGTVYVTAFSTPEVTVLGADGTVERTIQIGG